jgi:FKBP-type peptidyl-prolyl cis-trans isomerase 2
LQALFHWKVSRKDTGEVLDNSQEMKCGPFDLRMGRKFVMPVWEDMVRTMGLNERALFEVEPDVSCM